MPEKLAGFYDILDELGIFDYGSYSLEELEANQKMYYEMIKMEFPELYSKRFEII